jgi:type IV secretion system protein VirB9
VPKPGASDERVRTVAYDPANVVSVIATDLRSTLLQFDDAETVDLVALGDTTAWAYQKARNLLFIKPSVAPARATNMQVVTLRKDGAQRVYQFSLAGQPADTPHPVFAVNFAYPADVAAAQRKAATERAVAADADLARQRLSVDLFYGVRNWQYMARGSTAVEPSEVSDNGTDTVFRFPGNTQAPGIYQVTLDGQEQIASVTPVEDLLVVHSTARLWRLRLGKEVVEIANQAYDPAGFNPRTGTTSPEVIRKVKAPAR